MAPPFCGISPVFASYGSRGNFFRERRRRGSLSRFQSFCPVTHTVPPLSVISVVTAYKRLPVPFAVFVCSLAVTIYYTLHRVMSRFFCTFVRVIIDKSIHSFSSVFTLEIVYSSSYNKCTMRGRLSNNKAPP